VIANAGSSAGFKDVLGTGVEDMRRDFEVNTLGPVRRFPGLWAGGLLFEGAGGGKERRFVLVTSSMGSIATLEAESLPGVVSTFFSFFSFPRARGC
jgi:hypothetical protein